MAAEEIDRAVRLHLFGAAARTARLPSNPETAAALGIPAALDADAEIETARGCCDATLGLAVRGRALVRQEGLAHFALPALRWWDHIGFT